MPAPVSGSSFTRYTPALIGDCFAGGFFRLLYRASLPGVSSCSGVSLERPACTCDSHFPDPLEIFLVFDGLGFAGGDDLIQQCGHLLVEGRVVQVVPDDLAADVVLDGLGDGSPVAFQSAKLLCDGIGDAGLDDQLEQAHVVEGGDLARFVGFDVGVDQVAHVGFVGFQVEGFAAGLADDLAQYPDIDRVSS